MGTLIGAAGFIWGAAEHGLGVHAGGELRDVLPQLLLFGFGVILGLLGAVVLMEDLVRNEALDAPRKWLWAAVAISVPPAGLGYWWTHVRPFANDDELAAARRAAHPKPISETELGRLLGDRRIRYALGGGAVALIAAAYAADLPLPINLVILVAAGLALRLASYPEEHGAVDESAGPDPS